MHSMVSCRGRVLSCSMALGVESSEPRRRVGPAMGLTRSVEAQATGRQGDRGGDFGQGQDKETRGQGPATGQEAWCGIEWTGGKSQGPHRHGCRALSLSLSLALTLLGPRFQSPPPLLRPLLVAGR